MAIERGRLDRQLRELALDHAAGNVDDAVYPGAVGRAAEPARRARGRRGADRIDGASRRVVRAIGDAVRLADLPADRSDLIHAVYERIVGAGSASSLLG